MEDLTVLLVDDEEEFTSALAERLNLRGIRTRTCSNGEDALRIVETEPPVVVVLDLMMPGLSGKEVMAIIKSRHPQIGVVLLTGNGCAVLEDEPVEGYIRGYLVKPVSIDELIRNIRAAAIKSDNR